MRISRAGRAVRVQHWVLSTMVGAEEELDFATAERFAGEDGPALNDQCMWPYAAVAALLATGTEAPDGGGYVAGNGGRMPALRGRAFCTLPTPIYTGLPVHVDSRWELKVPHPSAVLGPRGRRCHCPLPQRPPRDRALRRCWGPRDGDRLLLRVCVWGGGGAFTF